MALAARGQRDREAPAPPPAAGPSAALARLLVRHRTPVFLLVAALSVAAALWGSGVSGHLSSGGYTPERAESARAEELLTERFGAGSPDLVLLLSSDAPVDRPEAVRAGREFTERVRDSAGVVSAESFWTGQDPALRSEDGDSALVLARLAGDEGQASRTARDLLPRFTGERGPFTVTATGPAVVSGLVEEQSRRDLTRAELIAAPLTLLILLAAFGSMTAALLPVLVGAVSVVGALAVLRLLASFTDVSLFAMNLTTALGFGLAVDYSLFVVTRYREELARGRDVGGAVAESLRTAGRTVLFSALTVAVSLAALLVFPVYFLQSLAYAGISVVVLAAAASVVLLPAVLALLGRRVDRFDVLAGLRRRLPGSQPGRPGFWYRLATGVMRRPVLCGGAVAVFLAVLALPFGHARFGLTDDRVLPRGSSAQVASDAVREDFPGASASPVTVVLPRLDPREQRGELERYARALSRVEHTVRVDSAVGSWAAGRRAASPEQPSGGRTGRPGGTWLSVSSSLDPNSAEAEEHVRAVRAVEAPAPALVGGETASLADTKAMLADRIPWAAGAIALSMAVLLFLFSGSVVVPLKALLVNVFSLTASFGAMVHIFQDGHVKWLVGDFVHTGRLEATVPLLMFCVAFGLSMDYGVFLLSRIREEYLATGDNTRAVVFGIDRTGRLISAAALVVATALAALATSQLSLLKLLGAGLALAVLVDATLVRGILVPAAMRLLGHANWWAPRPLRRLHERAGLHEG